MERFAEGARATRAAAGGAGTSTDLVGIDPAAADAGEAGDSPAEEEAGGAHLVVFVHGLEGDRRDLRTLRDELVMCDYGIYVLESERNEGATRESIRVQGARLAAEVADFAAEHFAGDDEGSGAEREEAMSPGGRGPRPRLGKITFVAHSMGSVVARVAVREAAMAPLRPRLWALVSLSGPHLGLTPDTAPLLHIGVSCLSVGRKGSLTELRRRDGGGARGRALLVEQAAGGGGLELFRHVVILYSKQDKFVPLASSCIAMDTVARSAFEARERGGCCSGRASKAKIRAWEETAAMQTQIVTGLHEAGVKVHLCEVTFPGLGGMMRDTLLGRQAHVEFLENKSMAHELVWGVLWPAEII